MELVDDLSVAGQRDTKQARSTRCAAARASPHQEQRVGVLCVKGHPVQLRIAQHAHVEVAAARGGKGWSRLSHHAAGDVQDPAAGATPPASSALPAHQHSQARRWCPSTHL